MRTFLRFLVFIISFNVNVTIHAETETDVEKEQKELSFDFRQEPEGCLEMMDMKCGLKPKNNTPQILILESAKIFLSGDAVILRVSDSEVRLIKGHMVIQANSKFRVQSIYGQVKLLKDGVLLAELESDRLKVTSLKGVAQLVLNTNNEKLLLPAPYTNWLGGVLQSGLSRSGRPAPGNFGEWINKWGKLTSDKELLKEIAKEYQVKWNQALETTGSRDLAAAELHQSQLDEKRNMAAQRKLEIKRENERLRKMFIEKTFGENFIDK